MSSVVSATFNRNENGQTPKGPGTFPDRSPLSNPLAEYLAGLPGSTGVVGIPEKYLDTVAHRLRV